MPIHASWRRDLIVAGLTLLTTVTGWAILDRLHWAGIEAKFGEQINTHSRQLEAVPATYLTRQEYLSSREQSRLEHQETMQAIQYLSTRIDTLMNLPRMRAEAERAARKTVMP